MYTKLQNVYMRFCEQMLPTADLQIFFRCWNIIYQSLGLQRWAPRPGMAEADHLEKIFNPGYNHVFIEGLSQEFANSETSELILVILEKL